MARAEAFFDALRGADILSFGTTSCQGHDTRSWENVEPWWLYELAHGIKELVLPRGGPFRLHALSRPGCRSLLTLRTTGHGPCWRPLPSSSSEGRGSRVIMPAMPATGLAAEAVSPCRHRCVPTRCAYIVLRATMRATLKHCCRLMCMRANRSRRANHTETAHTPTRQSQALSTGSSMPYSIRIILIHGC